MCMKVNNKNKYNQLTSEERDKIAILRAEGKSLTLIANMIGRNKSTISRELRRNRTPVYDVYLSHKAHERAITRKQISHSCNGRKKESYNMSREAS